MSRLVEGYTPVAYSAARSILRNDQDAKDVAHDSMLKVLSKLSSYRPQWRFKVWVARIARNTALDLIRKRRRLSWAEVPDTPDVKPLQDDVLSKRQEAALVHSALGELPPMYREVIQLHHFQEMKYREIAEELDVPIGTVMNRLFRARQKMKKSFLNKAA